MLIGMAIIFGLIFSLNKIAAQSNLPPIGYSFWQSLCAGLLLLVVILIRGTPRGIGWAHVRAYLVIGAVGIGLPISLLTYVAPELPVGAVTLVIALSPTFTYLLSLLLKVDRFYWLGVFGIAAGFAGVLVIVGPQDVFPSRGMVGWFLTALVAPIMFASSNVFASLLRPPATSSLTMASGMLLGSAVVLGPIMFVARQQYWFLNSWSSGDWALLCAIGVNSVVWILFFEIIRLAGPTFFAQFNYLAVLAGLAWGFLLFGEVPSPYTWIAFALMCAGVILTSFKPTGTDPSSS
jgi:drug/metabolite transporter (DMT)-like permease